MTGPYAAYILSAYGFSALSIIGLALWIALDSRAQKRALADLEARGIRRRSARADQTTPSSR